MFDKKVLCLGDTGEDTDLKVSELAHTNNTQNYGLISDRDYVPEKFGYYHTTTVDLDLGDIIAIHRHFDKIILLAQPIEQWSHPEVFVSTYKILADLKEKEIEVEFQDPSTVESIKFFMDLLESNKAFCIYPFMHLLEQDGNAVVCGRSFTPIKPLAAIKDWQTDPDYTKIREHMIAGHQIPEHCNYCYKLESKEGDKGVRFHDTIKWTSVLGIKNLNDLKKIKNPAYVEVRVSNKCNIRCRSCTPRYSHLIDKEFESIGTDIEEFSNTKTWPKYSSFNMVDLDTAHTVYITGGEPTIMPEVYQFLRDCISNGRTDINLMMNTNAVTLSTTLLELFSQFPNLGFSCSLDGVGLANDYIRWGSKFDTTVKNIKRLQAQGHHVAFISVISIYNVDKIGELFEFFDTEFTKCPVQLQHGGFEGNIIDCFNRPDHKSCIESLTRAKNTNVYYNYSRGTKSIIDTMLLHYSKNPKLDEERFNKFFRYNDTLDRSRKSNLNDYLPALHELRRYTP